MIKEQTRTRCCFCENYMSRYALPSDDVCGYCHSIYRKITTQLDEYIRESTSILEKKRKKLGLAKIREIRLQTLYIALYALSGKNTKKSPLTSEFLSDLFGVSETQLNAWIRDLDAMGWVKVLRRGDRMTSHDRQVLGFLIEDGSWEKFQSKNKLVLKPTFTSFSTYPQTLV